MKRTGLLLLALASALPSAGCVTRRVMITSNPPGAMVYRNGQPIGRTPVEEPFTYYGTYHYRLIRDGYEPVDFYPHLTAPWYQWPGVDFFTENFIPYQFRDRQTLHFDLPPSRAVPHDVIRDRARQLQEEAKGLTRPADALPPRRPQPAPLPGGSPVPAAPAVTSPVPTTTPP
jgi:hypothetical protein